MPFRPLKNRPSPPQCDACVENCRPEVGRQLEWCVPFCHVGKAPQWHVCSVGDDASAFPSHLTNFAARRRSCRRQFSNSEREMPYRRAVDEIARGVSMLSAIGRFAQATHALSGPTRTSCLPKLAPFNRPMKAVGALSRPSVTNSLCLTLPSRTQPDMSRRKSP